MVAGDTLGLLFTWVFAVKSSAVRVDFLTWFSCLCLLISPTPFKLVHLLCFYKCYSVVLKQAVLVPLASLDF